MIRTLWLIFGFALIGLVIYLSLRTISFPMPHFNQVDKVQHLIAYGTLTLWFSQTFKGQTRYKIAGAFILMGIAIEFVQPFTGREFSYLDMLANSTGVLLGLLVASKGGDALYTKLRKPAKSR